MNAPAAGWLDRLVPHGLRECLRGGWFRVQGALAPEPYRTVMPYTMVALPRLKTLRRLAERLDALGLAGDVVECGTCNGGSGAILAQVASRSPLGRHTWLLDSFQGLPPATAADGPRAAAYTGTCLGQQAAVRQVLGRLGVPDEAVTLVPGWFEHTLPTLPVERVALLHIDADWYESVRLCLNLLFDRVPSGGFVVLDDYGYWEGCRNAWHEFASERGLKIDLVQVDGTGVYFQKP